VGDKRQVTENKISTNIFATTQKKYIVYFSTLSYKELCELQGHLSLLLL